MSKKPNTESEEVINVEPISFKLPYNAPFYILEISSKEEENKEETYSVFNTLEGAVEYIDDLDDDMEDINLLSLTRDKEQFSISQISWSKIYQISRKIKNKNK